MTTEINQTPEDSITLNDLVMCRNLIHIASKRGAFLQKNLVRLV